MKRYCVHAERFQKTRYYAYVIGATDRGAVIILSLIRTRFCRWPRPARLVAATLSLGPRSDHACRPCWHPSPCARTRRPSARTMLPSTSADFAGATPNRLCRIEHNGTARGKAYRRAWLAGGHCSRWTSVAAGGKSAPRPFDGTEPIPCCP